MVLDALVKINDQIDPTLKEHDNRVMTLLRRFHLAISACPQVGSRNRSARVVFTQSSVYGVDNSAILNGMAALNAETANRARAVVAISTSLGTALSSGARLPRLCLASSRIESSVHTTSESEFLVHTGLMPAAQPHRYFRSVLLIAAGDFHRLQMVGEDIG
jgi:hypothetical protein